MYYENSNRFIGGIFPSVNYRRVFFSRRGGNSNNGDDDAGFGAAAKKIEGPVGEPTGLAKRAVQAARDARELRRPRMVRVDSGPDPVRRLLLLRTVRTAVVRSHEFDFARGDALVVQLLEPGRRSRSVLCAHEIRTVVRFLQGRHHGGQSCQTADVRKNDRFGVRV